MKKVKVIKPTLATISTEEVEELVDLINKVFLDSEGELWPHDGTYFRTTSEEIKSFIAKGYLRFAVLDDSVVGMIKVFKKSETLGCFGMLIVNPNIRKQRIGSLLVIEAENWCSKEGLEYIELELLVANDFKMQDKIMLRKWYNKIGYRLVDSVPFESLYPSHASLIQVPCTFEIMRKSLG